MEVRSWLRSIRRRVMVEASSRRTDHGFDSLRRFVRAELTAVTQGAEDLALTDDRGQRVDDLVPDRRTEVTQERLQIQFLHQVILGRGGPSYGLREGERLVPSPGDIGIGGSQP